jgi:hypothetical protein
MKAVVSRENHKSAFAPNFDFVPDVKEEIQKSLALEILNNFTGDESPEIAKSTYPVYKNVLETCCYFDNLRAMYIDSTTKTGIFCIHQYKILFGEDPSKYYSSKGGTVTCKICRTTIKQPNQDGFSKFAIAYSPFNVSETGVHAVFDDTLINFVDWATTRIIPHIFTGRVTLPEIVKACHDLDMTFAYPIVSLPKITKKTSLANEVKTRDLINIEFNRVFEPVNLILTRLLQVIKVYALLGDREVTTDITRTLHHKILTVMFADFGSAMKHIDKYSVLAMKSVTRCYKRGGNTVVIKGDNIIGNIFNPTTGELHDGVLMSTKRFFDIVELRNVNQEKRDIIVHVTNAPHQHFITPLNILSIEPVAPLNPAIVDDDGFEIITEQPAEYSCVLNEFEHIAYVQTDNHNRRDLIRMVEKLTSDMTAKCHAKFAELQKVSTEYTNTILENVKSSSLDDDIIINPIFENCFRAPYNKYIKAQLKCDDESYTEQFEMISKQIYAKQVANFIGTVIRRPEFAGVVDIIQFDTVGDNINTLDDLVLHAQSTIYVDMCQHMSKINISVLCDLLIYQYAYMCDKYVSTGQMPVNLMALVAPVEEVLDEADEIDENDDAEVPDGTIDDLIDKDGYDVDAGDRDAEEEVEEDDEFDPNDFTGLF